MDDLFKNAVKTKNITNKNKMPDYMLKERRVEMTEISFIFELNFNIFDMPTMKEMKFWWFHFE